MKIGFDNDKYLKLQSQHIMERIGKFDNKLYLEFGDQAEIVIAVSAEDIEKNKIRADLGITYDDDVIRLVDEFHSRGFYVGSVVLTKYAGHQRVISFQKRLEKLGIKVYHHFTIPGYPTNVPLIVSENGYAEIDVTVTDSQPFAYSFDYADKETGIEEPFEKEFATA